MFRFDAHPINIPKEGSQGATQEAIYTTLATTALIYRDAIKEYIRDNHTRTGALEASWPEPEVQGMKAIVYSTSPVSKWLDRGTKRHLITPSGRALYFNNEGSNRPTVEGVNYNSPFRPRAMVQIKAKHYVEKVWAEVRMEVLQTIAEDVLSGVRYEIFGSGPRVGQARLRARSGRFAG